MQRFVSGDYAWFNPQAVMVAYVRDGTDAAAALEGLTGVPTGSLPSRFGGHILTTHESLSAYLDREPGEGAPGPIAIVHVWLDARPAPAPRP